mmetsp:Transcript_68794/g.119466  ORF Transcript_68794/g.119466 Transcript_68794/m.119466 type:complete len:98 (+) Transcript_68794:279-572(+)
MAQEPVATNLQAAQASVLLLKAPSAPLSGMAPTGSILLPRALRNEVLPTGSTQTTENTPRTANAFTIDVRMVSPVLRFYRVYDGVAKERGNQQTSLI